MNQEEIRQKRHAKKLKRQAKLKRRIKAYSTKEAREIKRITKKKKAKRNIKKEISAREAQRKRQREILARTKLPMIVGVSKKPGFFSRLFVKIFGK